MKMMARAAVLVALVLAGASWAQAEEAKPAVETKEVRDARMSWWREARFGMFVHWGLYSGLGGNWKGESTGATGGKEWIQNAVKADTWEYAHEAIPLFRPKEGFATEWANLARDAGCRYLVFTSKHHEGFGLFNSQYTDYDAYDTVGRDLCKEIVEAVHGAGLKVGFYHSVIDWHHPQYDYDAANKLPHPLRGKPSPNGARNHSIYVDYLHHQVRELLTNYGPIDIMWWDFSKAGNDGPFWRSDELMSMARELQPAIVSNDRLYDTPDIEKEDSSDRLRNWKPEHGDFTTPEQTVPATGVPGVDWEVCMTMNTSWGYSEQDVAWKPTKQLLQTLVDIVSKGGNYLLNVGPKGDAGIPEESVTRMREIGEWMGVNGDAIYGTTASPYGAPAWGRYTVKPGVLYAHVFEWPADGRLDVAIEGGKITRAYLLADAAKTELKLEKRADGTTVLLPGTASDPNVPVVVIEHAG
ncbi:MAG: alpha-L-fucosidase [FCB group bacterium]|jgi:alpha-L-fucosidase|nr:alpha-L-fucosidase [FCB group bacterium]